jgi:drug/metabolite transporter (DMT)-like permease
MDEKKRFRRFVAVVAAVLVFGAIFVAWSGAVGTDNWATIMSAVILATMALIAIVVVRKRSIELRSGFPKEDERSSAIKMRAGYIAFYVSLYFLLAMGFVHAILEDNQVSSLPTSEWLLVYVAVMGSIFLAVNAYLNRKGVPG